MLKISLIIEKICYWEFQIAEPLQKSRTNARKTCKFDTKSEFPARYLTIMGKKQKKWEK